MYGSEICESAGCNDLHGVTKSCADVLSLRPAAGKWRAQRSWLFSGSYRAATVRRVLYRAALTNLGKPGANYDNAERNRSMSSMSLYKAGDRRTRFTPANVT